MDSVKKTQFHGYDMKGIPCLFLSSELYIDRYAECPLACVRIHLKNKSPIKWLLNLHSCNLTIGTFLSSLKAVQYRIQINKVFTN